MKKILLLGDPILDKYIWGEATRISPEAPVPILKTYKEEFKLGGAANCLLNLLAFDLDVTYLFFSDNRDKSLNFF